MFSIHKSGPLRLARWDRVIPPDDLVDAAPAQRFAVAPLGKLAEFAQVGARREVEEVCGEEKFEYSIG